MEVLIFTDIHIHCHKKSQERLKDCLKVMEWVFETAKAKNIKNILFLGDLFHDRNKIDVLTYYRTYEVLKKYLDGSVELYLLLGNHDLWYNNKTDVSSVTPLECLPGVRVIAKPEIIDFEGQSISFLPYTQNPVDDINNLLTNEYNILCAHLAVSGAMYNSAGTMSEVEIEHDGDMKLIDNSSFNGWDQVFLGHYHAAQDLNNSIEYVGSPLQLSFGEAFQDKHILIYNLKTHKKQYIINDFSPKHFIVPQKDIAKYELKDNFIKIIIDDQESLQEAKEILKDQAATFEFKKNAKKTEHDEESVKTAKLILTDVENMLNTWIAHINPDLPLEALLNKGRQICIQEAENE